MSLTDDDKQWIRGELARFATEVAGVETQLARVHTELDARIERVETSLLTEFHKWASPVEMRQRSHTAALRALDIEVESLSDRVKKLEDDPDHRSRPEQGS